VGKDETRPTEQPLASSRDPQPLAIALEQRQRGRLFELADLTAEGRLGDVQHLGRPADVLRLCHRDKVPEETQLDHPVTSGVITMTKRVFYGNTSEVHLLRVHEAKRTHVWIVPICPEGEKS
jgi:hypothetical protein